jgi:hypothetical protein
VGQFERLRNLSCKRIQCDEIWSFCYAKEKNVPEEMKGKLGFGDVWAWKPSMRIRSPLLPSWLADEAQAM